MQMNIKMGQKIKLSNNMFTNAIFHPFLSSFSITPFLFSFYLSLLKKFFIFIYLLF